ncbi:MAG: hypothetical protein ACOC4C_04200 [Fibrobacterota bacterium]
MIDSDRIHLVDTERHAEYCTIIRGILRNEYKISDKSDFATGKKELTTYHKYRELVTDV